MWLCTGARGLSGNGHGPYCVGIREGTPEQVFSPSPESMIACQRGAVKALRGMLYGSRLVPVAFVSEPLKFCVCLQEQPEWSVAIRGWLSG